MSKLLFILALLFAVALYFIFPRILEIYRPAHIEKLAWNELYDLKKLDSTYVAQGIETYQDYLFYTAHKQDSGSVLIVFKFTEKLGLKHLFTTNFPKNATHVSDLSIYENNLYAIDYASNNLYIIDIGKTIHTQTLTLNNTISTHLPRSGSIIIAKYQGKDIIMISQFIINNNITAYKLTDLPQPEKKPIFEITSKYYIQGLYFQNNKLFISSNTKGIDPIFITDFDIAIKKGSINNQTTLPLSSPGKMVEDIVIYRDYLVTSDEETNKIYISKEKLSSLQKGEK